MKKILIILCTILCIVCLGIDVWCFCVYKYADEKLVENTMLIDIMEDSNGAEKKTFLEINYFSNKNKNGLEMLEIKYNYFVDETKENFFSVGSQYVADDKDSLINWKLYWQGYYETSYTSKLFGLLQERTYDSYYGFLTNNNCSYYEYQSSSDYNFSMGNDINTLSGESSTFKVTIGEDIFTLKFKGQTPVPDYYLGTKSLESALTKDINDQYYYVDHNFLAYNLLNSLRDSTPITNSYQVLEFGEFFDYYKYDGKTYVEMTDIENEKISTEFNNYYVCKLNIQENGARVANDSLFNQIQGNNTFNLYPNDYIIEDYFYGKNVIKLTNEDFNYTLLSNKSYEVSLKDEFIESYLPYSKNIVLDVYIDIDKMNSQGMNFSRIKSGFLNGFDVYKCQASYTLNGEFIIENLQGVDYYA